MNFQDYLWKNRNYNNKNKKVDSLEKKFFFWLEKYVFLFLNKLKNTHVFFTGISKINK